MCFGRIKKLFIFCYHHSLSYFNHSAKKGFTLLELLIVIGILAILTTVVVLTINPAEYLKQARDTKRVVDLSNINKAVQLFDFDNTGIISTTSSTIVYVSIPDTSSTCGNLGLPTLPFGYTYNCVTSDYLNKINGTGWIPLDLTKISGGSPLSSLPVDPINTTSTRNYYTYVQGGSFEVTAQMESSKHIATESSDGGLDPARYEIGSNLTLSPFIGGLVGYWNFEEGLGVNAYDYSGNNNNGSWSGTTTPYYAAGKIGSYSGSFDGNSNFINSGTGNSLWFSGDITLSVWIYLPNVISVSRIISKFNTYMYNGGFSMYVQNGKVTADLITSSAHDYITSDANSISPNKWYHIAVTKHGSIDYSLYINGVNVKSQTPLGSYVKCTINVPAYIGTSFWGNPAISTFPFNGYIDDVRVYNRALSAPEISAVYNATK